MSWLRLLAAGKSLVGLEDGVGRYRVRNRLPVFRGSEHPFRATTLPGRNLTDPAQTGCAGPTEAAGAEVNPVQPSAENSGRIRRVAALLFSGRSKPAYESRLGQPVQTELALERVRVVRNDLSDEDVEIVRARRTPKPSPQRALREPLSPEVGRNHDRKTEPQAVVNC